VCVGACTLQHVVAMAVSPCHVRMFHAKIHLFIRSSYLPMLFHRCDVEHLLFRFVQDVLETWVVVKQYKLLQGSESVENKRIN
jgi:hypothetical protein